MLELGQPLHAYDLAKLDGRIEARLARAGEKLTLLDGRDGRADGRHARDRRRARPGRAGRRHGRPSDGRQRNDGLRVPRERVLRAQRQSSGGRAASACTRTPRCGSSAASTRRGRCAPIERATELLLAICGGQAGPVAHVERAADLPERRAVALRRERLRAVLGVDVPARQVDGDFRAPRDESWRRRPDGWRVTPPAFRFDIAIEEDLIEEVGRMFGYDAIPATPGEAVERLGLASEQRGASRTASRICSPRAATPRRSPTASSTRRWTRS